MKLHKTSGKQAFCRHSWVFVNIVGIRGHWRAFTGAHGASDVAEAKERRGSLRI